jgi:hypothetical protein
MIIRRWRIGAAKASDTLKLVHLPINNISGQPPNRGNEKPTPSIKSIETPPCQPARLRRSNGEGNRYPKWYNGQKVLLKIS